MSATKAAGNTTCTYNSNAITNYCNQVDLQGVTAELEATHFGSTGEQYDPGLSAWTVGLGGDFDNTLDGYLGPDAITSTKRTAVIGFVNGGSTITYTWTSNAFITNYTINSQASGKQTWSAQLRLSGIPTRAVA